MRSRQLALDIPPLRRDARATYIEGPSNAVARGALARWTDWPGGLLALTGPADAGKSHLAGIWAEDAGARVVAARDSSQWLATAARRPLVIEDLDAARIDEAGLMTLFDAARAGRAHAVLITARTPPSRWEVSLSDLKSRLQSAAHAEIAPPDEHELRTILAKLFADRGVDAPDNLVEYLIRRMERSHAGARRLAAALDTRALANKARITRSLAQAYFAETQDRGGEGAPHNGDESEEDHKSGGAGS